MSKSGLEITILAVYVLVAFATAYGLCIDEEYTRLERGAGVADYSNVPFMAALWPLVLVALPCFWFAFRAWPVLSRFLPTPSRVALWLHNRSRVRRFVETTRAEEPTDYRDAGRLP